LPLRIGNKKGILNSDNNIVLITLRPGLSNILWYLKQYKICEHFNFYLQHAKNWRSFVVICTFDVVLEKTRQKL